MPRHNNAKTHFHGNPLGMMSVKGETTDFLCKRPFRNRGEKETTDSFIANDFSVLFRAAECSEASMTSACTL